MVYLRKDVVDAMYKAGLRSDKWQDFVNDVVMEKLQEMGKEVGESLCL